MDSASDRYITPDQVSERYHIPGRSLERWRVTGEGPRFIRLGRRRILYRVADVEEWLAGRTYSSRAAEAASKAA